MWNEFLKLFRRSRKDGDFGQGHMTFGQTSLGRTMSRTGSVLRKQLWVWPIVAVVLLAIVGYAVSSSIHRTMEDNLRSELETLLTVERSMLERWFKVQEVERDDAGQQSRNSQDGRPAFGGRCQLDSQARRRCIGAANGPD